MTARLKLLCHASTAATRSAAFPADEPLDTYGQRSLSVSPHRLRNADRFLTSPALRARQTAEALGIDAAVDPMLRDCDYGRWTGRAIGDVQAQEPQAVADWLRDPGAAPHGGESMLALMDRVAAWLDAQGAIEDVAVAVTHASVIRAAVVHALEAGPRSFWRIDVAPLSLTQLNGDNGRWTLAAIGLAKPETKGAWTAG